VERMPMKAIRPFIYIYRESSCGEDAYEGN